MRIIIINIILFISIGLFAQSDCLPFSDYITGDNPDQTGTITIFSVPTGSSLNEGDTFVWGDLFCPLVCGTVWIEYSGNSETCTDCIETRWYPIEVPCIDGSACDKLSCDITVSGSCQNPLLTVSGAGGSGNYEYTWSTSEITQSIVPVGTGVFSVIIKDLDDDCCTTCSIFYNEISITANPICNQLD